MHMQTRYSFVLFLRITYFKVQAGQPELIALEQALKDAMVPAGNAREVT